MASKAKGILRGLRYFSQIFDEKERDFQIGYPTDVKHVAHIGWDGGSSVDSPGWMNEFSSPQGFVSAPLKFTGDNKEDGSIAWVSQESIHKSAPLENFPPKSEESSSRPSRRQPSTGDSPRTEKPEKPKTRRHHHSRSRDGSNTNKPSSLQQLSDQTQGSESPMSPGIPKKTRPKKPKESSAPRSTRSRLRDQAPRDHQHESPPMELAPALEKVPRDMSQ